MSKLNRSSISPGCAATIIDQALPLPRGIPVSAVAWRDGRRTLRRVQADYADGWRVNIRLSKPDTDGQQYCTSSSLTINLKIEGTTA